MCKGHTAKKGGYWFERSMQQGRAVRKQGRGNWSERSMQQGFHGKDTTVPPVYTPAVFFCATSVRVCVCVEGVCARVHEWEQASVHSFIYLFISLFQMDPDGRTSAASKSAA